MLKKSVMKLMRFVENTQFINKGEVMERKTPLYEEHIKANGKITIAEITSKYGISDESAERIGL